MRDYALERAALDGVPLTAVCADMCEFQLAQRFDLAFLPMDSASYLLDNAAVLRHFGCVARHLAEGGLYVLEMSHPRDTFGTGTSTNTTWTSEEDGFRVDMQWGCQGDMFDPITQVDEVTVKLEWSGAPGQWTTCRTCAPAPVHIQRVRRARSRRRRLRKWASGSDRSRLPCRSATTPQLGEWCRPCTRGQQAFEVRRGHGRPP